MYTLRCTRKLLKRLSERPTSEAIAPTTTLGDWYANLLYTRPQQLVMAMSERSLLCVLVPAKATALPFEARLRSAVAELLLAIGVPDIVVADEVAAMSEHRVGATASRSVLGCMNDATYQLEGHLAAGLIGRDGAPLASPSLLDLELHLAQNIYSVTGYALPWRRTLELFGCSVDENRRHPGRPGPRGTVHRGEWRAKAQVSPTYLAPLRSCLAAGM